MTEAQRLLERIQQQDTRARAELYDLQAGLLFAIILRIHGNNSEAEDVLQEVFVQIWEKAGNYDPSLGNAVGWIVTLAREDFLPVEAPAAGGTAALIGQEKAAQVRQALTTLCAGWR